MTPNPEVLVELLNHQDMAVVAKAAECIGNFALDEIYRTKIREMDGVSALLVLLDRCPLDSTRLAAAGSILNLAIEDASKTQVRSSLASTPMGLDDSCIGNTKLNLLDYPCLLSSN